VAVERPAYSALANHNRWPGHPNATIVKHPDDDPFATGINVSSTLTGT